MGNKLKELRADKTIEEISVIFNLSPNTYEAIEKGERMPPENIKYMMADFYDCSIEDIWG